MKVDQGYNGLSTLAAGLPAEAYYDVGQYEREMAHIWRRNWLYVTRSSDMPHARSFLTFAVGDQRVLLLRDDRGVLRAYYNSCRHRGSILCVEKSGTLGAGAIVCPYHAWIYGLDGSLLRTSSKMTPAGFDRADYSLYPIRVHEWRGFVFVAFTDTPPDFATIWDMPLTQLDGWPLEELKVCHVLVQNIACNWKTFWENYNECLHCPLVHPELSRLVPIFGRGLLEERDDPQWQTHQADPDPRWKGGMRTGASTWSLDGRTSGRGFPGLSDRDRGMGHTYMTAVPSVFIAAHVDYVRVVRLLPLGPEQIELRVEYLFPEETSLDEDFDICNVVDFANTVLSQDAAVCELAQQGLHAAPHKNSLIMPEEYLLLQFHRWVAAELGRAGGQPVYSQALRDPPAG